MSLKEIACDPKARRNRRAHRTVVVFSILLACSVKKLNIQKASTQLQTEDAPAKAIKSLWIAPKPFETGPE